MILTIILVLVVVFLVLAWSMFTLSGSAEDQDGGDDWNQLKAEEDSDGGPDSLRLTCGQSSGHPAPGSTMPLASGPTTRHASVRRAMGDRQ